MHQSDLNQPEAPAVERCRGVRQWCGHAVAAMRSPAVWLPLLLLALLTALFRWSDADMQVSRFFVKNVNAPDMPSRWPLGFNQPWRALYDWGLYPAWVLGCGGLLVWIASFRWSKMEPWRDEGLFYALLLFLAPGILVNVVVKPCWGRPRPNAIIEFHGNRDFLPVWSIGEYQDESSFPSGHASMGFYLMAPAFVYYRRRPWLAAGFMALGLTSGTVIGLARVVAGGHFPSDVIWAGGFVYFSALALASLFRFGKNDNETSSGNCVMSPIM